MGAPPPSGSEAHQQRQLSRSLVYNSHGKLGWSDGFGRRFKTVSVGDSRPIWLEIFGRLTTSRLRSLDIVASAVSNLRFTVRQRWHVD